MKKIFLFVVILSLFYSCSPKESVFILDNPSYDEINIILDGKEYALKSGDYENISLKPGKHTLILSDKEKIDFIVYVDSMGGVLNPTRSDYVYVNEAYVKEGNEKFFSPNEKEVIVGTYKFNGAFEVVNDLIIDKNLKKWKYDIHVPFPNIIYTHDAKNKGNIFTKIFTQNEFLDYMAELGIEGKTVSKDKPVKTEKISEIIEYKVPPYKNPNVKKCAEKIIELDKAYATEENVKKQRKMMAEYKKAWENYVQANIKDETDSDLLGELKVHNLGRGVLILN